MAGLVSDKRPLAKEALYAMPHETQITRHIYVEGWDYIGKWSGVPLRTFLERIGADMTAKYVGSAAPDGYSVEHRHADGAASADHPRNAI